MLETSFRPTKISCLKCVNTGTEQTGSHARFLQRRPKLFIYTEIIHDDSWPLRVSGQQSELYKKKADLLFVLCAHFFEETFPGNTSTLECRLGSRRWRKIQWRLTRKTAPFFVCVFFQAKVATGHPPRPSPVCSVVYVIVLLLGRWRVSAGNWASYRVPAFLVLVEIQLTSREELREATPSEWLFIRSGLAHWNQDVSLDPWVF